MSFKHVFRAVLGLTAVVLAAISTTVWAADEFPKKGIIRILTPYEPGSMVDITSRQVADGLSKKLGQTVIVENHSGGFGQIAMNLLLNAPADGYTLLSDTPASAINPTLYKAKYNPKTDIAPIAQFMQLPFTIAVSNDLPVNTAQDLVALAKKDPDSINVAVAGTSTGLVGDLFAIQNGLKFNDVNYKGASPAMLAVLKNEAQVIFMDSANVAPHISAGKMKGLLVTGDQRFEVTKNVPTAKEAGFANFTPTTWFGLFGRASVPKDVQDKINAAVREVMQTPQLQQYLKMKGATASNMTAPEFKAFFNGQVDTWADVIKKADIKVQ